MTDVNLQRLREHLRSLECPVCHRCSDFDIAWSSGYSSWFLKRPDNICCEEWLEHVRGIYTEELTRAENCELTGTRYEPIDR